VTILVGFPGLLVHHEILQCISKKKGRAGEDNLGNQFTKRYESGAHRRVRSPEGWRTLEGEITGGGGGGGESSVFGEERKMRDRKDKGR
jgi:hypothetical protein